MYLQIENLDGWPDKICIQCVHQVSRCHAFKKRVEKSDEQLKEYIKGITVIVEEPVKEMTITQIEIPRPEIKTHHHMQRNDSQQQVNGEIIAYIINSLSF